MGENLEKITDSVADIAENGVPINVGFETSSLLLLGGILMVALSVPVLLWHWSKNN
jgi:hypothetical protein